MTVRRRLVRVPASSANLGPGYDVLAAAVALHMELEHLQLWGAMLRRYEGRDPEELFGSKLAVDFKFQENKEYIRRVLDQQRDLRLVELGWVMQDALPADWPSARCPARAGSSWSMSSLVDRAPAPSETTAASASVSAAVSIIISPPTDSPMPPIRSGSTSGRRRR